MLSLRPVDGEGNEHAGHVRTWAAARGRSSAATVLRRDELFARPENDLRAAQAPLKSYPIEGDTGLLVPQVELEVSDPRYRSSEAVLDSQGLGSECSYECERVKRAEIL